VTKLRLRPYGPGDTPAPGSVGVSVVILTRDEERNVGRCLASARWAEQVVVVDSGSSDDTMAIAARAGAEVVRQPWLGFSGQRDFALNLAQLRHDWVYFVDADQWVSPGLAAEIADRLRDPGCAGFSQRRRLVFQGTWMRHSGWYSGSWVVQLMDRRRASWDGSVVGERARVSGPVQRLRHDLVDEDRKGLPDWLRKHIGYAQLEARHRARQPSLGGRARTLASRQAGGPLVRTVLKDVVFPSVPAKPLALFLYMYVVRLGFLDGRAGWWFCCFHAWVEAITNQFREHPPPASSPAAAGEGRRAHALR
jgi:glycosyltransferase involved in cell wall biosynthesis